MVSIDRPSGLTESLIDLRPLVEKLPRVFYQGKANHAGDALSSVRRGRRPNGTFRARASRMPRSPLSPRAHLRKAPRLVVVDDEDDLRTSLVSSLRRRSPEIEVADAACAAAALDLLGAEPDLLVTDLRMQGLSGVGLVLAARAKHPQVRVLVMTAYLIDPRTLASARTISYLEKPFELHAFVAAIDAALARPPAPQVLGEIAQLFGIGQQSGGLLVQQGKRHGRAWFEAGVLHDARMDVLEGEPALDEMLRWSRARFEVTDQVSKRRTVSSTYAAFVAAGSGCVYRSTP